MHKLFLTTAALLLAGFAQANDINAPAPESTPTRISAEALQVAHGTDQAIRDISGSKGAYTVSLDEAAPQTSFSEGNAANDFKAATSTTSAQNVSGAVAVASVPEPVSSLLFGSGLLGLSLMRRRVQRCFAKSRN